MINKRKGGAYSYFGALTSDPLTSLAAPKAFDTFITQFRLGTRTIRKMTVEGDNIGAGSTVPMAFGVHDDDGEDEFICVHFSPSGCSSALESDSVSGQSEQGDQEPSSGSPDMLSRNPRALRNSLAAKETTRVEWGCVAVLTAIVVAAALVSSGTYLVLNDTEEDNFQGNVSR
jgi:hypothetical protein